MYRSGLDEHDAGLDTGSGVTALQVWGEPEGL